MKLSGLFFINSFLLALCYLPVIHAQEVLPTSQDKNTGLELPSDLVQTHRNVGYQISGSKARIDTLTVKNKLGIVDIYENVNKDNIWYIQETELGQLQNIRKWKFASW